MNIEVDENIFYNVTEFDNKENEMLNLDDLKDEFNYNDMPYVEGIGIGQFFYGNEEQYDDHLFVESQEVIHSLKEEYLKNYTVKSLHQIMEYYELPKKQLKKHEIVETLLTFETDEKNREVVKKRLRLWANIIELKNHKFFSKYIIFDI